MTLSNPAQYISGRTVQEQMNSLIDYVDQRAADVALDAIASDVAQVHQDMLDADADATAAAASAAAAAGTLTNAVKKTGEASQSIAGDIVISGTLSAGQTTLNGATAINANTSVTGALSVSGNATLSGVTSVTTEATGTYSNQAANGLKVKNELDNYAPMVRTSGNQTIAGTKTYTGQQVWQYNTRREGAGTHDMLVDKVTDKTVADGATWYSGRLRFYDGNDVEFGRFYIRMNANGTSSLCCEVRNSDGTFKFVQLAVGDVI